MNKKGFTLVELLLTLVLVSLIIGLVFQNFNKEIDESKISAYNRQVNTIIEVAKSYHLQNNDENYVTVDDLNNAGLINKEDLIDPRNGFVMDGCVVFNFNTTYNQYEYKYEENLINCN